MNKSLLALPALLACAHSPEQVANGPGAPEVAADASSEAAYTAARVQVDADLQALEALEIFEVRGMVETADMHPGSCYGPCPDDDARRSKYVAQADRLHALVELAQETRPVAYPVAEAQDQVQTNLASLEALQIVALGDFLVEEPQARMECYNLPCPEDIAEADRINTDRATQLMMLASWSDEL